MNFETVFNLPIEIETFLTNLLANSHCPCHVINPKKTRVILWKEVKDQLETYHLRIGLQRLISYACLDRSGETYWKFETYKVKKAVDPVFNQRPEKPQPINHDESNSEQPTNPATV